MGRAQLEHELMVAAQIDFLQVLALVQVPEVQPASVLAAEQDFGNQTVLEGIRCSPLAGHHRVVAEVPPEIIGQFLGTAIDLPFAEDVEAFGIEQENPAGRLAFGVAESIDVDAFRSAVDRVHPGIAGFLGDLLGLDHLHDLRIARIGLGIEDVQSRRAQARHDEVAPLHVRVRGVRAQARGTRIPTEVMKLVADIRHVDLGNDLRITRGLRVDVDHGYCVRFPAIRIEGRHIGQAFARRLGRHPW